MAVVSLQLPLKFETTQSPNQEPPLPRLNWSEATADDLLLYQTALAMPLEDITDQPLAYFCSNSLPQPATPTPKQCTAALLTVVQPLASDTSQSRGPRVSPEFQDGMNASDHIATLRFFGMKFGFSVGDKPPARLPASVGEQELSTIA